VNFLEEWAGAEVDFAMDGCLGARKLKAGGLDLALIDGTLPGLSGMHLARIAAHENTPTLLMSGHPAVNDDLERFGFPYLVKPFTLSQLLEESRQTIEKSDENIRRIKQSVIQMLASMEQLKQTPAGTKTVLDRINATNWTL
jgi:DNA-binding response OmpR family regulator